MPDFDANDDLTRLPGIGQGDEPEPAPPAPIVRRNRQEGRHARARRLGAQRVASRRRALRRACSARCQARVVVPSRRSRRLLTACGRRPPGSSS